MIDSLISMMPRIEESRKYLELGLEEKDYVVATFHRPSNVDDTKTLGLLVNQLLLLSNQIKIVFPVHPRTLKALQGIDRYHELKQNASIKFSHATAISSVVCTYQSAGKWTVTAIVGTIS